MKFLCLADLHYNKTGAYKSPKATFFGTLESQLSEIIKKEVPDAILIAGDVVESRFIKNGSIYQCIREMIPNESIPVIFCLGNHEFVGSSPEITYDLLSRLDGKSYNCCCLDVDGHFDIGEDIRIIGNVLWYDNTLKAFPSQPDDVIEPGWLDELIYDFIPSRDNAMCRKQIANNIAPDKRHVLVTHCVPFHELNWFTIFQSHSPFNIHSGCYDALDEIKDKNVIWAISGHTHKRMNGVYHNINCVNIGNDYFSRSNKIEYFCFEM